MTQAALGDSDGGKHGGDRAGHREGSRDWEMVAPPLGTPGGVGTTLVPHPRERRSLLDAQRDLGIQDRGSGVSVSASLPCTP